MDGAEIVVLVLTLAFVGFIVWVNLKGRGTEKNRAGQSTEEAKVHYREGAPGKDNAARGRKNGC